MEICGHEILPELVPSPPKVGEAYRSFQRMITRLEHQEKRAKRAAEAARLAKQQAMEEEGEFYLSDPEQYFADANLRAKVRKSKANGLLDLPPEVLILIVGYAAVHPFSYSPPNMKSLRLVHPQLGNLRYLKQKLFATFTLTPHPDQLWMVRRSGTSIAPFVTDVVFRPVIIDKTKIPRARQNDTNAYIKKIMKPRIDEAIANGKAQSTFVDFLQKLKPNAALRVQYSEQEEGFNYTCPGPPPQPFLKLVVASLAVSKFRPSEVQLHYCTQSALIWSNIDGWADLDLGALKSLRFSFTIRSFMLTRVDSDKHVRNFAAESSSVLQCLLKKSSSTLQDLTVDTGVSDLFSGNGLPALPALRSVKLTHEVTVNAMRLCAWLASSPKLQSVVLRNVKLDGDESLRGWRPVFDAIRSHQSYDLSIELHGYLGSKTYFTFLHRKSDPIPAENFIQGRRDEMIKMLKRYMSQVGEWEDIP